MSSISETASAVRTELNHAAMSMTAAELDRDCEDILAFYGEVFGWSGFRLEQEPGAPLVIRLGEARQFIFVYGDAAATQAGPMDHFGVEVATEGALDTILERTRRFQARDSRVHVVEKQVVAFGDVETVSCYIGFVLPLLVEVQHFRPGA